MGESGTRLTLVDKLPKGEVRLLQRGDLDLLVARMGVAGRAWPEVDGRDATRGEVGDVRPGLLRLEREVPDSAQRADERRVDDDVRRRRVAHDLDRCIVGHERPHEVLGAVRGAIRGIAQVQRRDGPVRDDVVGRPAFDPRHGDHLVEREAVDDDLAALARCDCREPFDRAMDRVVGEPWPRGVTGDAVERHSRREIADTAGLDRQVGRLEQQREVRLVDERCRVEEGGEGVVLRWKLLATEEEERNVDASRLRGCELPYELERDGDAALHVARATPVNGAARDVAGHVVLCGDGVVVAGEHEERRSRSPGPSPEERLVALVDGLERRRHERPQVRAGRGFVAALGGDVDELERPCRQPFRERAHDGETTGLPGGILREMTRGGTETRAEAEPERGLLLAVLPKGADGAEQLAELHELARTAGVAPIAHLVQHRTQADPRSYVGKGKLEELKTAYGDAHAEVLLVDDELKPTQQRTLEDALSARVVDRTQLILDIFAQHAVSAEGKLQVELAQLEYNLPRMRGMWKHLERQAGGGGTASVGGGVGTRGPGESQLETDRRLANRRITQLKRRLVDVSGHRATRRKARTLAATPTVALAGYTNVGKSTLLNALTGAEVSVENRLFETLDPTTRVFEHEGKRYLVTDTVGFIRRLPTQLIEGFAATLEETLVADLVLHVVDGSLPEDELVEQRIAVETVLAEIGAGELPVELVANKVDRLGPTARRRLANRYPEALQVSAVTGEGLDELRERIAERFSGRFDEVRLLIPYDEGRILSELYALGAPIEERRDTGEGVFVRARLPGRDVRRFARYLVAGDEAESAAPA